MSLIDKISDLELSMIENYIDVNAFEGTNCSLKESIRYILRLWDREKSKYLIDLFDGKLILTKEISIEKGINMLAEEIKSKIMNNYGSYEAKFIEGYWNKVLNGVRCSFLSTYEGCKYYDNLHSLINSKDLAKNIYEGETFEVLVPEGKKNFKVQHGAKITRTLQKMAAAFDIPYYEEFRLAHSQVLNQKMLKGELCLSIHPLDYMTMSDNNNGWHSCMSWRNEGCYRQGTVEMMNSPCVVVAYLKSKEDMPMEGCFLTNYSEDEYVWNSKKWRELFIINKDIITNVKAYPYRNDDITKEVLKWLKALATNIGYFYRDKIINYIPICENVIDDKNYYIYPETNYMYNDMEHNSDQWGYFGIDMPTELNLYYSGPSECMSCGEEGAYLESEGNLVGECCYEVIYCHCCGKRVEYDEAIEYNGEYYCPYCYENSLVADDITGELVLEEDMLKISLLTDDNSMISETTHIRVCADTLADKELMKRYFKRLYGFKRYHYSRLQYCVKLEDLTDRGREVFGFYESDDTEDCFHGAYWLPDIAEAQEMNKWNDFSIYNYNITLNTLCWYNLET